MNIQTIIMSRGGSCNRYLLEWLQANDLPWRFGSQEYGIACARNQNCNQFLREDVPQGKTHLLMIDDDMVPLPETDMILRIPTSLAYCGYLDRGASKGHVGHDDFGAACMLVSSDTLLRMKGPPWFVMQYDTSHARRTDCECNHFRRLAASAGITPVMVGVVGHLQSCVLVPNIQSQQGRYKILWPWELDAQKV